MKSKLYWYKVTVSPGILNSSLKNKGKEGKNVRCSVPQPSLTASRVNHPYPPTCMGKETFSARNSTLTQEESSHGHISPLFAVTSGISRVISSEPLRTAFSPRQGVPHPLSPRLLLGLGWLEARERVIAMPVLKENKTHTNFSGHRF